MGVADCFTSHRSFATHHTSLSHSSRILPNSVSESNRPKPVQVGGSTPLPPLQYLKGVGPARAQQLEKAGIRRPEDLLTYYPRDWDDRRFRYALRQAPMGEKVALRGVIQTVEFTTARYPLGMASIVLSDSSHELRAVWFKTLNPRYDVFASLRSRLAVGRQLAVYGMMEWGPWGKQLRVDDMAVYPQGQDQLAEEDRCHFDRIVPVYSTIGGLSDRFIRSLIYRVLSSSATIPTIVPAWLQQKLRLPNTAWALRTIHFPERLVETEEARETLAFEEFFLLETALAWVRKQLKIAPKPHSYELKRTLLTPFRQHLGFDFTPAQKRVIREILDDMMSPFSMNRLLQGDVGSGKTLVALSAMLLSVENGGQAALMAPTEILAEQHALTFKRFLGELPVRFALVTGKTPKIQRQKYLEEIAKGEIHIVIGTHALLQGNVKFSDLRFITIDEQHRFGVDHRRLLREKGANPDVLVMTATPIPRTLALTVYGDLDVSVIDQLPPGRSPVLTRHVSESDAYATILKAAARGEQAYVVYPLVKESDKTELKAAVQEAELLCKTVFKSLRVGVLHGQLPSREKEAMMDAFRTGTLDVLIATSIIEVGIDVPNATVMAIQHAERFGLSTLHQLRGRVGRGTGASQCLLIAQAQSADARKRIEIMTHISDGFRLSEEDLQLRGPGEVMGVMQHGLPEFRIGNLAKDAHLIQQARQAAEDVLSKDPKLNHLEHSTLKQGLIRGYLSTWSQHITG